MIRFRRDHKCLRTSFTLLSLEPLLLVEVFLDVRPRGCLGLSFQQLPLDGVFLRESIEDGDRFLPTCIMNFLSISSGSTISAAKSVTRRHLPLRPLARYGCSSLLDAVLGESVFCTIFFAGRLEVDMEANWVRGAILIRAWSAP